jgi:hypothetical protein
VDKSRKALPRPLSTFTAGLLRQSFARQGFTSGELVSRWAEIVGEDIAAHAQPIKMQWPRPPAGAVAGDEMPAEPATLVLRVEGPAAIEIQHLSSVILERVNRYFGWQAVGRLALRQAPLRRQVRPAAKKPDPEALARIARDLPAIEDESLRDALARLGAAIKGK